MPRPETLNRFIALVEANAHIEAVEQFYAENSSMRENQGEPRIGRDAHLANERRFLSRLKSLTSKCVRPIFVNENFVVIRWNFTFELHDGGVVTMDELTYQRWEDERIVEETFFFDPAQRVPAGDRPPAARIGQKSYEMPPREGISIAHFLTVADVERSARYYESIFGARILSLGDGNAPGYLQLANIWMILNVGGGPTPDKPTVTLSVPDPDHINSFMNFRVADIQACYELWKGRGAQFITEPLPKYGETRCYIRDPDGYIIEIGQSTDLAYG